MFGNILKTPEGRKAFKRVMVDALRAGTATSAVTPKEKAATNKVATQTNPQKKKKKKAQPTGMRMSGTGSKSKVRSLLNPM